MTRNTQGLKRGGPGRPKGVPNKATAEAKQACAAIVDDPTYRRNLAARARAGRLAPAVECMLWHYAYGKPKEHFQGRQTASLAQILAGDFEEEDDE